MNREERRRAGRQKLAPGAWAVPETETLVLDPAAMLRAAGYPVTEENVRILEAEIHRDAARRGIPITEVDAGLTGEDL